MNLTHVKGGNIPLTNAAKFEDTNKRIGHVARRLGDLAGAAREKAEYIIYNGKDSIKDVLSGMFECVTQEDEIVQCIGQYIWQFNYFDAREYYLPESVKPAEVAEAFWSFVCESFAGYVVELCADERLEDIRKMKKKTTGENNFIMATHILLNLSYYRTDIIHEPIFHGCIGFCAAKIISYAAGKASGESHVFSEMLQKNAMWRCYDGTGNYGVLHKLLTIVALGKYNDIDKGEKLAGDVVEMLLECGAQPQIPFRGNPGRKTSLQLVATFGDEDVGEEVAKALLLRCDEQSVGGFVNAADDQGRTALHMASQKGNAGICELLLDRGASLTAQDKNKETALHYAFRCTEGKVIDVLLKNSLVSESLALKDSRDYTPLDIAVIKMDTVLLAKLLSKTEEPEAHLSKVTKEQLLRRSILVGSVNIVSKLFEKGVKLSAGDCDDDGKTAFHLAAMCNDESSAIDIIGFKIEEKAGESVETMVAIQDRRGRTALHEAALKGHDYLCLLLLEWNSELIYVKDRNGQNSLYDAVRGEYNAYLFGQLQDAYLEKDRPEDDLVDRSGLTPLHVAVSEGKVLHVRKFLSSDKMKKIYLSRGDMVGQTALHKATKRGDNDMVDFLLENGAQPLRERDCDGRTALHYAVQVDIQDKTMLIETLLKRCTEEEKSLLLWASAAGIGTADEKLSTDDSLHKFLSEKKKKYGDNLLRTAASIGQIQMTKELLSRGYPIDDIRDEKWMRGLSEEKRKKVKTVSRQIEVIKELGNDKPAIADSLGRMDYARGLAALFLNPYIKPPIAVGITGFWGMGKSSLMLQTERVLFTTAAHMALLQSSKLSNSASNLPEMETCKLSKTGERKWKNIFIIKYGGNRNIFVILWDNLKSLIKKPSMDEVQQQLEDFLNNDELKNKEVFKALAAMDSSEMLEKNVSKTKEEEDPSGKQNVPAVLTVQYNAWKYKNDTEALAGLAVEITKELEGIVTPAQWLNTCWQYNWEKKKYTILLDIFIPYFFAMVLAGSIAWISWIELGSEKFKKWGDAKYAWPPAAAVTILWTLTRKVKGILQPISSQLMQYASAPDHTDKLGYQERVISDIKFLKAKIGEKPHGVFIVLAWVCSIFLSLLRYRSVGKVMEALKISPASCSHLRTVVFVDDLDRCDESVILQVLSAVNLVLAECEISVFLGMDKRLIERAILNKHGNQNVGISLIDNQKLAEMYLQKIIQMPLDLPDPSDEQTRRFLRAQFGVLQQNEDDTILSSNDEERDAGEQNVEVQGDLNVQRPSEITERGEGEVEHQNNEVQVHIKKRLGNKILKCFSFCAIAFKNILSKEGGGEAGEKNNEVQVDIHVQSLLETTERGEGEAGRQNNEVQVNIKEKLAIKIKKCFSFATVFKNILYKEGKGEAGVQNLSQYILRREILFVSYSEGEEKAFSYFQRLATGCRKLPREGKRLLNYHRLVWYIFSVSEEANDLNGWQVQLITWIFVCWEWEENMDFVIKKWKEIVNTPKSKGLSLLMIVEQLMEEHQREMNTEEEQKNNEGEVSVAEIHDDEETKSSSCEEEEVNEKKKASSKKLVKKKNATSMKHDAVVKSLAKLEEEMEKQIKELQKQVSGEIEKQIKKLQKQVSNEMKKDINELKRQMVIQQNGRSGEYTEPEKLKFPNLENWKRMKKALERYDVPMDAIQAFQRFRFYCIAGYLPPPSSGSENAPI